MWPRAIIITISLFSLSRPAPAQRNPTVADAQAFLSNAEAELLKLSVMAQRAEWVAETYITGDT